MSRALGSLLNFLPMNINRLYLIDMTNADNWQQAEVARSMPNEVMPTVEYEIPVEYEVHKIKVIVGYGNTDTYLFAARPDVASVEQKAADNAA